MKYTDLNISMKPHPFTGDLLVKTEAESVKQAIATIVRTNYYERPFAPKLAGGVTGFLFENPSGAEKILLSEAILDILEVAEPRADIHAVDVIVDNQSLSAKVTFSLLNADIPVSVTFFLNRLR